MNRTVLGEKSSVDLRSGHLPFLKWPGGKRWLTPKIVKYFPENYQTYIEPFLGGGAVFFALAPENAILGDLNFALINCYLDIQSNWAAVYDRLRIYHSKHSKNFYYEVRDSAEIYRPYDRSARFIYLNRTCFNAIYRVNLLGKFNVPIGTKTSVVNSDDDFESAAGLLRNAKIFTSDFETIVNFAKKGDLLYCDPPYTVKHENNGFIKYNEKLFSWSDQIRLRDACVRAAKRGAYVFVSNAEHRSVRDLYRDVAKFSSLRRSSVIASEAGRRGNFKELLIELKVGGR
jgi:DNA adenine methylase